MNPSGLIQAEAAVKERIKEADLRAQKQPKEAIQIYLAASEEYLRLSRVFPTEESRFVNEASALYMKARSAKSTNFLVDNGKQLLSANLLKAPERRFKDIAGLEEVKEQIRLKIIEPFRHPEIYAHYQKKAGGGILMYGPPGCGKSLIAEATAGEAGMLFFNVKASDLKSKYVGETEKNIHELFEQARAHAPAIIFFDEIEALGQDRMSTNHIGRGFVSQILTEMDGVGTKDAQVLLLAATNTPWLVDNALLRPGRFGESLFIPPPDLPARLGILKTAFNKRPLGPVDLSLIAQAAEGFSGADMVALGEDATDAALKECLLNGRRRNIEYQDFAAALAKRKPSIIPWFRQAIMHIHKHHLDEWYNDLFTYLNTTRVTRP
jgi:SpoVK/Ycf46/Vps4 family AAA+-type ATPase